MPDPPASQPAPPDQASLRRHRSARTPLQQLSLRTTAVLLPIVLVFGGAAGPPRARGQVLVVNVWASWCVPCRAEQPELSAVARAWRGDAVEFVGVNLRDDRAAAQAWVDRFQVPYPSLYDRSARIAARLQVTALPTTVILGRDGVMAYRLTGPVTAELLDDRIATLLGQAGRWAG